MKTRTPPLLGVLLLATGLAGPASAQIGPQMVHPTTVSWKQGVGLVWLLAEKPSIQYLRADLFVVRDLPFGPIQLGQFGTLRIDPGNLVHVRLGMRFTPFPNAPSQTFTSFTYPTTHPGLVGVRLRIQVLAHDATIPGRYALSQNAVVATIIL